MREFNVQDRITLFAKLAAGAMNVAAEPRDTAAVEVLPYDDSTASREAAERTVVEMRGSALHVESPEGGWRLRRSGRIRVDVRLPEDSRLVVRVASADTRFDGRYGDATIDTASGDVTVDHVAGTLTVKGASADVRVARVEGQLVVDSASGDVVLGYAGGDVIVGTSSGDITLDKAEGSVRAQSASGDLRLGSVGQGNVQLSTASGDVRVGIAAGTSVWLDLSTASGSTRSDLDHGDAQAPANGVPDLNLRVRTASGDIELRRVAVPASA
jgi:DUF4097 and DUF4098 domain-containing protein YvlB